MKNIRVISEEENPYHHDCVRISEIMHDRGYNCSVEQARELWEKFSESMAAGWMNLGEDAEVFQSIRHYFEEIDG